MSTTSCKSRSPQFPPLAWLGYGLDLTRPDPFDFKLVVTAKTQVRIVDTTKDTNIQTVTIGGIEYEIPKVVSASEDHRSQGSTSSFTDGTVAVKSLQEDSALAHRLLPVTTSDNSLLPLNKSLPTKNQFYFFANDHDAYSGKLRDYLDFINEEELLIHVSKLPPFEPEEPEVVQAYIDFFNAVGSHFISSTGFGARFLLEVWASNKYEEVNSNFGRDVTASVKGLNDGGEYDTSVFREPQYQIFSRLSQRIVRVRGGNPSLAEALMESPDFTAFQQWTQSILANPELVTFRASELWTLLRDADNKTLRDSATHIRNAFEYLSSLRDNAPNDNHTWVSYEMKSDWGEFGILTPSAVIGGGDSDQIGLPGSLSLGPSKLHFGSPSSTSQHFIAVVDIINDGTPIDVYISSGSGSASVKILGQDYATNGGTKWYSCVPVSL